jgi:hypothetical protein
VYSTRHVWVVYGNRPGGGGGGVYEKCHEGLCLAACTVDRRSDGRRWELTRLHLVGGLHYIFSCLFM